MSNRPWDKDALRLGISMFYTQDKSQPNLGLAWFLYKLQNLTGDEGEIAVNQLSEDLPEAYLTAAEYRTLREDCGLSQQEAAIFHKNTARSIAHWEDGKRPVSPGAAAELIGLRTQMDMSVQTEVQLYKDKLKEKPELKRVTLYRYKRNGYEKSRPYEEGLLWGAHNRLIALTAERLSEENIDYLIEYA